jgi:fibronectin-binding autotransporter adhesin
LNYSGKFDAKVSADGSGLHANGHVETVHAAHAPADAIVVQDANLLFLGEFKRSGVDLVLSKDDRELVLHDYFKAEKRAPLSSPDGAHLTGDLVNALSGHVQYAQADGSASVSHIIGHVSKLVGTATAMRNGVVINLNNGDNVEKGDVIQSGSNSTLGITFIDGTVFGLSSNARMVLNEMIYDPNGSNNSSLLSLVAGTITFVAGETAKHGDMKIDTPVATMGIRGTAVLCEIDIKIPLPALDSNAPPLDTSLSAPTGLFQVLVEPDGTTGSYILFDKTTLTPFVEVKKANEQWTIANNIVSHTDNPLLTPDVQKLILDTFTIKFADITSPNSLSHHTDISVPTALAPIKLASGAMATPFVLFVSPTTTTLATTNTGNGSVNVHIDQAPGVAAFNNATTELPAVTGSNTSDTVSSKINFVDINPGDSPTVTTKFGSFMYQNANGVFTAGDLNNVFNNSAETKQLATDIATVEANLTLVPDPGNNNNGSATWTYSLPDKAFDFLAKGETLTLTYNAIVDNNYLPLDQVTTIPFTITITGSNDAPVITTGPQTVQFQAAGKGTPGGNLNPTTPTSGTLVFTDPDLTDTHTVVSTNLTSASLAGADASTLDLAGLEAKFPGPLGVFQSALTASVTTDSTGTGTGTISWQLAELKAFLADFIPNGETLALTYTVEVADEHNAISTQNIDVAITGDNTPAVVWIETTDTAATDPAPGSWNSATNWETGTVPTANDDVIITTDQLEGKTPFYPVTIAAEGPAAFANSVTMNDFQDTAPVLDNFNTLSIGAGGLSLNADSILNNLGTLSVGGLAEISQQSVLKNSGLMTFDQGGDFGGSSSITNTGTIEIAGGTLNVEVVIQNNGGTIQVDDSAILKLNVAAVDGGTINEGSGAGDPVFGSIDVAGSSTISNAVLNYGGVTIESGVTLTLVDDAVNGTAIMFAGIGDTLKINQSSNFKGTIGPLAIGDTIDLTDVTFATDEFAVWTQTTTANGGSGNLQIFDGLGTLEATLNLTGMYSTNEFALTGDNTASHGTDVNLSNYVSFSDGTINSVGGYRPEVSNAGHTIELTNGTQTEATSWFANTVYSISGFTASFDYHATGDNPADGLAFILQNSSAGVHALGDNGGSLGYGGGAAISPSAAIEFNLYAQYGQGTAFETDGATGQGGGVYNSTGSVAFWNGDEMHVVLSYNGSMLTETLTDLTNGATYTANYTVDLVSVLGAGTAYVGFSAGTGAFDSTQTVSNFVFTSGPAASSTIVATVPNQTLSGSAASDNFVFNFAGVGHTTVTDFHPLTDTLQFGNAIFANAQAALNATQDDGHGNTVVAIDAHDTITLSGVLKAQLHAADFHVV